MTTLLKLGLTLAISFGAATSVLAVAPALGTPALGAPALGAPALAATPVYSSDGCVINHSADGPVAGGSQCANADLSGDHLAQSDFDGANLTNADLSTTDVQASTFNGANITGADFTGARIVGADFTGAGILPATLEVTASTASGAPVTLTPTLPKGITMAGCSIAGEAVAAGAVFPLGQSGVVCSFASSRPNEVATALVMVTVSSPQTSAPPVPVFTQAPTSAAPSAAAAQGLSPATATLLVGGAGLVVLLGVVGLIIRGARGRSRH
jgi:hypothetical protein